MSAPTLTAYPHEADPAVPIHTATSAGPNGTTPLSQGHCLHCRMWFPLGESRRCAHRAYAAAQTAS